MPPDIQVKLLRAIESRMVRRLGGKKEIQVDIRIVAATNRDLQRALDEGELREDLYYRLAVVELYLPPLRERAGDIQLLANEFLARYAQQNGKQITGFDDAAVEWILTYSWPGNVRDLKNAVERAVVLARGPVISTSELMPRHLRTAAGAEPTVVTLPVGSSMSDARRQLALRTFASVGGDLGRAAKVLGISPVELRAELTGLLQDTGRPAAAASAAPPDATMAAAGIGSAGMPAAVAVSGGAATPPPGLNPIRPIGGVGMEPPLAGAIAAAGADNPLPPRPGDAKGPKKLTGKRPR
jgi:DNA-binding NtrC family response regulator